MQCFSRLRRGGKVGTGEHEAREPLLQTPASPGTLPAAPFPAPLQADPHLWDCDHTQRPCSYAKCVPCAGYCTGMLCSSIHVLIPQNSPLPSFLPPSQFFS